MKSVGRITYGRSFIDSVASKWTLGLSIAYHVIEHMGNFYNMETNTSKQHVALRDSLVQCDEKDRHVHSSKVL